MSKRTFIAIVVLIGVAPLMILVASDHRVQDWVKFQISYRDYLAWKRDGGPTEDQFIEPLVLDRNRDTMVTGLTYDKVTAKFPTLVDGEKYDGASYKGRYLKGCRANQPETRLLWFRKADGFDWCVRIDAKGSRIEVVKG